MTTHNGFVINFTPDGRIAEKEGEQEYDKKEAKDKGKIETMILHVTKIIKNFKKKQQERRKKKWKQRATRGNNEEMFDERMSEKFVIAMDNYFTLQIFERVRNWSCWDIAI